MVCDQSKIRQRNTSHVEGNHTLNTMAADDSFVTGPASYDIVE